MQKSYIQTHTKKNFLQFPQKCLYLHIKHEYIKINVCNIKTKFLIQKIVKYAFSLLTHWIFIDIHVTETVSASSSSSTTFEEIDV